MAALPDAAHRIQDGLVQGEAAAVARQAETFHDGFVLEPELADAERQAPMAAVPPAFVRRDRAFHALAADLAAAGRDGDNARQRALIAAIIDARAGCHASKPFPGCAE